ncbi:MAG TPA: hypothetical protein VLN90_06440 [Thioalkalivibrio sp.]|nr:hypothetical protein [Thioalkalivibrio sp.]
MTASRTRPGIALLIGCLILAVGQAVLADDGRAETTHPTPDRILMVASDDGALHQRVLSSLHRHIASNPVVLSQAVASTPRGDQQLEAFDCEGCLVVSSGVVALQAALERIRRARILAIAIPEESFERIMSAQSSPASVSAIYMDVSLERMVSITRARLVDVESIGIISGDGKYLQREQGRGHLPPENDMALKEYNAAAEADVVKVFQQASRENQAILAIPDPRVYNRDTIVGIMLTTYRSGTPLIGYSEALNRAGALMSVFSSPEMLGEEAGQHIAAALAAGSWQPMVRHTERHIVAINQQVARSLRLRIKESP